MPVITEIEDLKRIYRRRVPKMFYDYAESGSWSEQTFRENTSDFNEIRLRQRIAVDMAGRTTATEMVGQKVSMPVALGPRGALGDAKCGWRDQGGAGRGQGWRAVHPVHHVDLLDRGCGREY